MADRDAKVKLQIELDQQAQSQIDQAVTKLEGRLTSLGSATNQVGAAAQKTGSALKSALGDVQSMTQKDIDAVDELRASLSGAAEDADNLQQKAGGSLGVSGLRRTGSALTQLGLGEIGRPVQIAGDVAQVAKEVDQLKNSVGGLGEASLASVGAIGALGVAVIGVSLAVQAFTKIMEDGKQAIQKAVDAQKLYYTAVETGTTDSIKKQIEALEAQKKIADDQIANIKGVLAAQTANDAQKSVFQLMLEGGGISELNKQLDAAKAESDKASEAIDKLNKALDSTQVQAADATDSLLNDAKKQGDALRENNQLADMSLDALKKRRQGLIDEQQAELAEYQTLQASGDTSEKVTKRMEELKNSIGNASEEIDKLDKTFIPLAKDAEDAAERVKNSEELHKKEVEAFDKQQADIAKAVQKYDEDVKNITAKGVEERLNIERKYQDTLVSIALKAKQQAEDDLTKLGEERQKNAIDAGRAEMDATMKAQEEEVKLTTDHLRKLEDIRQQARQREAGFILDRNFLGLFQSQMQTRNEMQGENTTFGRAVSDNARQMNFEHQQRIIAYQRANEDALRNYELQRQREAVQQARERQAALQAERTSLTDLRAKITNELTMRRQGIVAELQLIQMGDKQKLALQQRYIEQSIALLRGAYNAGGAGGSAPRASVQIQQNYTVHQVDPVALAHQNAVQTMQIIRHVAGAGY